MRDIVIDCISKSYGDVRVFDGFSAVLKAGRIYRLTAPSGAGKTTLLRMLMRLEMPDSGSIDGIPKDISAVFQEDRLLEQLSVYDNIAIAAKQDRIIASLKALGISEYADKPVSELSGGMKRRVALIRAMLHDSELVLLDEPFTGLDDEARSRAAKYLLETLKGRTCVIASHISEPGIEACSELIDI